LTDAYKRRQQMQLRDDKRKDVSIQGILGVGLDAKDGHTRITRAPNFLLMGGSETTHEKMQEQSVRFNEKLEKSGKRLSELELSEFQDLARDSGLVE